MRDRYGPPEVVEVRAVDRPVPTADQVLVRVPRRIDQSGHVCAPEKAFAAMPTGISFEERHHPEPVRLD